MNQQVASSATMEDRARRCWPPQYGDSFRGGHSLWLKGDEAAMMKDGTLTSIIRLDDRGSKERTPLQYLHLFEPVAVYYIQVPGNQKEGRAPVFEQDNGKQVMLVRRLVTRIADLRETDLYFQNGGAVPGRLDDVIGYIESELAPGTNVTPETVVTIYHIVHLPDAEPAAE